MQVLIIIADIVNASNTKGILFLHYKNRYRSSVLIASSIYATD